jgi:hypothetical protein
VPVGVVELVDTVMVELPEPVIDVGLNEAFAPDGNPLALRLTELLKPFRAVTEAV